MAYARTTATAPDLSSVIRKQRRRLCTKCTSEKGDDGMKWCTACRLAGAIANRMFYWNQKKQKLCVRCVDDALRTKAHGVYCHCNDHNEYKNTWSRTLRQTRRAEGLCARCGSRSPDAYHCDACKAKAVNATPRMQPPPRQLRPIRKQAVRKAA